MDLDNWVSLQKELKISLIVVKQDLSGLITFEIKMKNKRTKKDNCVDQSQQFRKTCSTFLDSTDTFDSLNGHRQSPLDGNSPEKSTRSLHRSVTCSHNLEPDGRWALMTKYLTSKEKSTQ
jgi:hypothetical protein